MAACDLSTLVSESSGYSGLSPSDQNNAFLYLLAKTLLAEGGTDYTDINTLRDAVTCFCGLGSQVDAFKAQVAEDLAVRSTAYETAPGAEAVMEAVKCWNCGLGNDERRAMEVFLLCALFNNLVP